ncbi:MAG TPA: transcription termination/antitermination NusG family protein [Candidatus Binatia bacterium]|nr:transcription termination/antitermination NusG family protein [Candidatus Binatia bacterium]
MQETPHSRWYVVRTKVRREEYAQMQLARRGVETFLPRIRERARVGIHSVVAPLFPGYLLVQIDLETQYFDVVWTPGVNKFVTFGETPCPLDDSVVEYLRARAGVDGVIPVFPIFREGDRVRVKYGPMAGLEGFIESPSRRGRVRILMELLRRQTRVELPEQFLDRIPA